MSLRSERDDLARDLERARRRIEELERAVALHGRDPLTGLRSMESFRTRLSHEVRRAHRHDRSAALVLLELDRVPELMRAHGFASADATLRAVIAALRAGIRGEDVLARLGDAQFALLLCDTGEQAAAACVRRLLDDIDRIEIGPICDLSISVGVAALSRDDAPIDLLERAGHALADAIAAGGGRVVTVSAGEPSGAAVVTAIHQRDAVEALAVALLERDRYTGEHSESVVEMSAGVARALGLSPSQVEVVRSAALLHDIGKVGIPDAILHKPGPLTPEEREVMAEHPLIGERILRSIGGFGAVADIVRHEHESFDGGGYPDGIVGNEIPIGSRIILACDAYHAMTSDRPYRKRMSHADAFAELKRCAGSQFDPDVTAALIAHLYYERAGHRAVAG
jgi:diguanylate cyclase (GGDEF)-like protein/putative nucleotidyltransferase with HDIG domain